MDEILNRLIEYGYVILFFYSLGGGFFALAAAGVLASMGRMDLTASAAVAATANFLGDEALMLYARTNRRAVLGYLRRHRRLLAYSHLLMRRWGVWVIFLQKYIYGVKTVIPVVIGLGRYDPWRFTWLNLPASVLWAAVFATAGYAGGKSVLVLLEWAGNRPWALPLLGGAVVGGAVAALYFAAKRSKGAVVKR